MNFIFRVRGLSADNQLENSLLQFGLVAGSSSGKQAYQNLPLIFFVFRNPYISIAFININKQLYIDYIYNIDLDVFISNNNFGLKRNFPCITYKQIKQD